MRKMELTDCHVHLQEPVLAGHVEHIIRRAQEHSVSRFVCNGTRPFDWPIVKQIAQEHESVSPCYGLHPWFISQSRTGWQELLGDMLNGATAVGEIGLDGWIENSDEKLQQTVFRSQLELAYQLRLPAVIHCVQAWGAMMDILRTEKFLPQTMIWHSFGGSREIMAELASMGGYFSFAGNVLRKRQDRRREVLRVVPLERLLLETDSPNIIPPRRYIKSSSQDAEGKQINEPANLAGILEGISAILEIPEAALTEQLQQNYQRAFLIENNEGH